MTQLKKIITSFIILMAGLLFSSHALANTTDKDSKVNIILKSEKVESQADGNNNNNGDHIYSTAPAKPVNLLPQTGEIVTSFIIMIIGLSVLLFVLGIYINKSITNDVIEMELQI